MLWRTGIEIGLFTGYSVKYSLANEPEQIVNKISGLRMSSTFREIDFTQKNFLIFSTASLLWRVFT